MLQSRRLLPIPSVTPELGKPGQDTKLKALSRSGYVRSLFSTILAKASSRSWRRSPCRTAATDGRPRGSEPSARQAAQASLAAHSQAKTAELARKLHVISAASNVAKIEYAAVSARIVSAAGNFATVV